LLKDNNSKIPFTESREIVLLIHDTDGNTALNYLGEMEAFLSEMQGKGWALKGLPSLVNDANSLLAKHKYDDLSKLFGQAELLYSQAVDSGAKLLVLGGLVSSAKAQGLSTQQTDRLLKLAELAFARGDYALALERLKEAELTYSLETKGEFNAFDFVLKHPIEVLLSALGIVIALFFIVLSSKFLWYKRKLYLLNAEGDLLLNLIQGVQKRCFVENKMSIGEYYDALAQFEDRLAKVSEDTIETEAKKRNVFKFTSTEKRLNQEKDKLLDLIKTTQKQYFDLGLIETRIYETKMKSLTKRLSEIEEQIVLTDYKKLARTTNGIIGKYVWRLLYKTRN